MAEFKSYQSYQQFHIAITTRWRYVREAEQTDFLQTVLATSVGGQQTIAKGSILWRAQLGHDCVPVDHGQGVVEEVPAPLGRERMKPRANRAREGRANPKGIPYLYLATSQEIALAEVRPWIGSYVSVAQFATKREVRLVNCVRHDHRIKFYLNEPVPKERERIVWQHIERAFSRPVTADDDTADYAPTQVLAEFFRENGLDGVAYGSSLGLGYNLALFDLGAADLVNCNLVRIDNVKLDFTVAANPYFVTDTSEGGPDGA